MNQNTNSVESLVAQIQGLSGDAGELSQLRNYLKQSEEFLRAESARLAPLLAELDPCLHSLGYLYILEACTSTPIAKDQANEFLLSVARFINVCSVEQIRMAPDKFVSICKRLKEHVMLLEDPMRGVAPLLTSIRKLQCYKAGFSVLGDDIFEFDQPRDLFLYCYYGGMICIGQKQFRKALELLHSVVTAPMTTIIPLQRISDIEVEAYKKYILVSLIHLGQFATSFPKYTSPVAQEILKKHYQPYIELANNCSTGKVSNLEMCLETNKDKFESDKNLGLVKQVVSSMYKHNIQRLTQTYLTLSLQDIANTVQLNSPKEAEMQVLQMIQKGEIYATINQKDGMVRFLEDPEQYKSCQMIERLDSSIQRIMTLSKKLTTMNEVMSCDPTYLRKVGRERQKYDFDAFEPILANPRTDDNMPDLSLGGF